LRVLESGEIRAVGDTQAKTVNVRIVSATNRDLEQEVKAGRFREDLYYRLAVVKLTVPPLRERPEDIPLLARDFARGVGLAELPGEIVARLQAHTWPGNARELRNAVHSFVAIGTLPGAQDDGGALLDAAVRKLIDADRPYAEIKEAALDRFTRAYLQILLARTAGNQSEAARISGLERSYLGKLVAKYGIPKR
jgi:DNA-binding NtrC family response regulator